MKIVDIVVFIVIFQGYCIFANEVKKTCTNAITYKLSGRFGDNLLTVYKALWLSRKYGMDFALNDFKYCDKLVLYACCKNKGQLYTPSRKRAFKNVIALDNEAKPWLKHNDDTLYITNYYAHLIDWDDELILPKVYDTEFIRELKRVIRPIKPLLLSRLPKHITTVAVHVRKGGGYDLPLLSEQLGREGIKPGDKYIDTCFLLKFPPDSFYIEQIAALFSMFNNHPLYIYLFTDDRDPKRLADKFTVELNNPLITIDYRKQGNAHNANVLEDFFSMTRFDCLIRGDSSYSKAAQLLANYKVVMFPEHGFWQESTLIIDKVGIIRM